MHKNRPLAASTPVPAEPLQVNSTQRLTVSRKSAMPTPVVVQSDALFAGADEVLIEHRGLSYRLRKTALGKLILTK